MICCDDHVMGCLRLALEGHLKALPKGIGIFKSYGYAQQMAGHSTGFCPAQFVVMGEQYIGAHQREACAEAWTFADLQGVLHPLGLLYPPP